MDQHKQMVLNQKKSNVMIFNFTKDFQFTSRTKIENETINIVKQTKLLGVIVTDTLSWDENTSDLVKRANGRMRLLHKLVDFGIPQDDLINIYVLYGRSILDQ